MWLIVTGIRYRDALFWDAPMSKSRHFGDAVEYVMKKFCSVKQQTAAIQQMLPRRESEKASASLVKKMLF